MEVENFKHEESDDEPIVRMNAEKREQLGVKLGDTVVVKKTVVESVKAVVHQAKSAEMDTVILEGRAEDFESDDEEPDVEVNTLDEEEETEEEESEEYEDE